MPPDQLDDPFDPADAGKLPVPQTEEFLASFQSLLETMARRQESQGEILSFIAQCVAPKGDDTGEKLSDLLATLISRFDQQMVMQRTMMLETTRLFRNLPLDIVRAINDNLGFGPSTPPPGGWHNGNGHDQP